MRNTNSRLVLCLLLTAACEHQDIASTEEIEGSAPKAPGAETIQAPVEPEAAPQPSPRLDDAPAAKQLLTQTRSYFAGLGTRRIYVQVDKPLYRPGETIWLKTWNLRARDLLGEAAPGQGVKCDLISPKGAVVLTKMVRENNGMATNDFVIPEGVQGGEYKLRVTSPGGGAVTRPIIVSAYEPPRIKKKLEFVRKAYGPGDQVSATLKIKRATGEPLADHPLRGTVMLDGETLSPISTKTNAEGGALVSFKLPSTIERGDGLLTVLVEDGGITESISKRIPIILKKLQLSFYPEGGQLVQGLPTRLYFEAKNMIGKPADISGRVVDDHGVAVAKFETYKFGLGRIEFTPATGRSYAAEITKPVGISERFNLPVGLEEGCVLRSFDDLDGGLPELRVAVRCTEARKVTVIGVMRENVLDAAGVQVPENEAAIVYLRSKDESLAKAQGIARVTVLDESGSPLAERIVYRNRRNRLNVAIETDQKAYIPREQVALTVRTTDASGKPVPAELAVSVVDDTVISFADDKTGHMLSKTFLEPEIPGKVEEPNFYFNLKKKKSARAMDLLMGTRGWRKFEWKRISARIDDASVKTAEPESGRRVQVEAPEGAKRPPAKAGKGKRGPRHRRVRAARPKPAPDVAPAKPAARKRPKPARRPKAPPMAKREAAADRPMPAAEPEMAEEAIGLALGGERLEKADIAKDEDWAGADKKRKARQRRRIGWAQIRVFPAPTYTGDYSGPRTDFRETIHWAPAVKTGKTGKAIVTFYLSDAVTSFRVFAEGAGGSLIGRQEETIKSSLPFSMSVKLPLEVSAGDKILMPLTLSNERNKDLPVSLESSFGKLVQLDEQIALGGGKLAANQRASLFFPLTVTGKMGKSKVRFSANAGGLTDDFQRELTVVPVGFPITFSETGTLEDKHVASFDLGEALEGSISATIKLEASPVGTLLSGLAGMLREPYGCFEQTSSTNYPNVMVMQYLQSNRVADPDLVARSRQLLDRGYKRLVGFEAKEKGYEWFGRSPAHEALTAYGLLEFADMKKVYSGVDNGMMKRTVRWLKTRRDGKGGFLRDSKALDSFGRADPEITNAYVTYSIAVAGLHDDFKKEIEAQTQLARTTDDPYLLSLAANTLLHVPGLAGQGKNAAKRLAGMQKPEGHWAGKTHSVTRSTGSNLTIETTSLALLALMKAGGHDAPVFKGVNWLYKARSGHGSFGTTQATVLALKALTEFSVSARKTDSPGRIRVLINGTEVAKFPYAAGRREPIALEHLGRHFKAGPNKVELIHEGDTKLPFTVAVDFRSVTPATHPEVVVDLQTRLERSKLKMGENVRLTATIKNKTSSGQPMTLARIGLPGGLTFQNWQLKELREKGTIAFYETRAREVILYFRDLQPEETKEIPLDLVATVPGTYTGPASSAYLYYTNDRKVWAKGLEVGISR